jgi:trehalose 6-phosphate phosphatase
VSREPSVFTPALTSPAEMALRDVATADSLLVALDFDGVLAPLQDDPDTSRMVPESAVAIAELVRLPRTRVAMVSGRDIATLRRLALPPEGVWMIGSHGAEADLGPDAEVNHSPELTADEEEMLAAIDAHIDAFAHALPEVRVEEKPYSRTVHTRGFDPQEAAALHAHATKVAEEFPAIRVIEGHDITELAVKQATKGDGLRLLARAGEPTAMAYFGDDVTDEDAFTALDELTAGDELAEGLTVKVGPAETRANWRIADPAAVAVFLGRLAAERSRHLGERRI